MEKGRQIIYGTVPSKSNSYRIITINGKGAMTKTDKLKKYEQDFYWQCNLYRNANITSQFRFHIDVYYPTMRFDLDGVFKCVLDCLQKVGAIKNDSMCSTIHAEKFIDKENPRIEFIIEPV